MHCRLITLVVLSSLAIVATQEGSTRAARTPLFRMNEMELSLQPTAGPNNVDNCIVVSTDGRALLELRRQEFFNGRATKTTYEGTLNPKQLDILRTILQGDEIRSLPQFIKPSTPMAVDSFHVVTAKIYHPPGTREIGYFESQGQAPENAVSAGENWSRSATAMKPLVEWFHSLKSTFPWRRASIPTKGVCDEP